MALGDHHDDEGSSHREESEQRAPNKREGLSQHPEVKKVLERWFHGICGRQDTIPKAKCLEIGLVMMQHLLPAQEDEDEILEV